MGLWGLLAGPLANCSGSFIHQIVGALVIFGRLFVSSLAAWFGLKASLGKRVDAEEV